MTPTDIFNFKKAIFHPEYTSMAYIFLHTRDMDRYRPSSQIFTIIYFIKFEVSYSRNC